MKKAVIIPAIALLLGGAVVWLTPQVDAFGGVNHDTFVSELAQRLGVSQQDVSSAMDEIHSEHQQEMATQFNDRLDEAVANGELTSQQKDLILQKHDEMVEQHQNREEWQNLEPQERQEQMQTKRDELEDWAQENNIDMSYFGPGEGRGPGNGSRSGRGPGDGSGMRHWQE